MEIIHFMPSIAPAAVGTWDSSRCWMWQEMRCLIRRTRVQVQQHSLFSEMRGQNLEMPFKFASAANTCQCFKMILLIIWDYSVHVLMERQKNVFFFLKQSKHWPTQLHCNQFSWKIHFWLCFFYDCINTLCCICCYLKLNIFCKHTVPLWFFSLSQLRQTWTFYETKCPGVQEFLATKLETIY